jgi:hypothetical protein
MEAQNEDEVYRILIVVCRRRAKTEHHALACQSRYNRHGIIEQEKSAKAGPMNAVLQCDRLFGFQILAARKVRGTLLRLTARANDQRGLGLHHIMGVCIR